MLRWIFKLFWFNRSEITFYGESTYNQEIVGESFYQNKLKRIAGGYKEHGHELIVDAILINDNFNKYDKNAVAVTINKRIVGHLSKSEAQHYRSYMNSIGHSKKNAKCKAIIVGGWKKGFRDKGNFGVKLDMPENY